MTRTRRQEKRAEELANTVTQNLETIRTEERLG